MAEFIVAGREQASARAWSVFATGVLKRSSCRDDEYHGSATHLLAAGIIDNPGLLPGQPGMAKVQLTLRADGTLAPWRRGANTRDRHQPGARVIVRTSTKFRVRVTVSDEEYERRLEIARCRREGRREGEGGARAIALRPMALAATPPKHLDLDVARRTVSLGNAFLHACDASPAAFRPGDAAWLADDDEVVEVVEPFSEYDVHDAGWRLGYVVRVASGSERFCAAHQLYQPDGALAHLRLVPSQ
jgi:hypothetical protein